MGLLHSEARKKESFSQFENDDSDSIPSQRKPSKLLLDDENVSFFEPRTRFDSKPRGAALMPNSTSNNYSLIQNQRMLLNLKPRSSRASASVHDELKRLATSSSHGMIGSSIHVADSSSSLKANTGQLSAVVKQRAKVSAADLSSEYVQQLLKETSLEEQMKLLKAKTRGYSEGNRDRGVLERALALKTRDVNKSAFLLYLLCY